TCSCSFIVPCCCSLRYLHSFPTRRSSDLHLITNTLFSVNQTISDNPACVYHKLSLHKDNVQQTDNLLVDPLNQEVYLVSTVNLFLYHLTLASNQVTPMYMDVLVDKIFHLPYMFQQFSHHTLPQHDRLHLHPHLDHGYLI